MIHVILASLLIASAGPVPPNAKSEAPPTPQPRVVVALETPTPTPRSTPTPPTLPTPVVPPKGSRERIIYEAEKLTGLRETHGPNRSPQIDEMNRLTGVPMGSPWCASWNAQVYHNAGVAGDWPRSAWSPSWVARPTWTRAKGGQTPLPGDAFGIFGPVKSGGKTVNRVKHTGLIEKWGDAVHTREGNTGPTGSVGNFDRDGDGSYAKRRLPSQIHSVRDWVD